MIPGTANIFSGGVEMLETYRSTACLLLFDVGGSNSSHYRYRIVLGLDPFFAGPTQVHKIYGHRPRHWCGGNFCRGGGYQKRALCRILHPQRRFAGSASNESHQRLPCSSRSWHVPGAGGIFCRTYLVVLLAMPLRLWAFVV